MNTRNIFIGDVHWCIDELEHLLDEVSFKKAKDRVFFTGDVVGKWPCSMEVLKLIESLKDRANVVMWNHEHWFCRNLDNLCSETDTAPVDKTVRKLARQLKKTWKIDMLKEFPYLIKDDDFILIHQGIVPWIKISKHKQRIKHDWRKIPPNWYNSYNWKREVVYWHWAKYWFQKRRNTTWIDTACVDGWYLTAYIPQSWDIIQQKCLQDWWY